jgi:hypothetical protein
MDRTINSPASRNHRIKSTSERLTSNHDAAMDRLASVARFTLPDWRPGLGPVDRAHIGDAHA